MTDILANELDALSEVVSSLYDYTITIVDLPSTTASQRTTIIGGIQSLNPSGSRRITESYEIGKANHDTLGEPFELVPAPPSDRRIEVRRIAFFKQEMLDAFGTQNVRTLSKAKRKFDINENRYIKTSTGTYTKVQVKTYKECYITRYGSTRDITGADVREIQTATIAYKTIEYSATTAKITTTA